MGMIVIMQKSIAAQIEDLERFIAAGDIPLMARAIRTLRSQWDLIDTTTQLHIQTLEAEFMNIVNLRPVYRRTAS